MRELEPEKKVYVCHFDILGMKSVLKRSSFDGWQVICGLADIQESEELPITSAHRKLLNERLFSDTVIISTNDDTDDSLYAVLLRALEIFRVAFRRSTPLRGGVAFGSWFEINETGRELFTGDALLRAYELGESQQMIGICLCDVVRQRFMGRPLFSFTSGKAVIKDYLVPLKNDVKSKRAVLNWPAICKLELKMLKELDPVRLAQHFYAFGKPEHLPEDVMVKYKNTIDFMKFVG